MKILITTSSFGKDALQYIESCNRKMDIILNPYNRKLTTEEFLELSENVDGVIAGVEKITREALSKRPNIKVISRCGVGIDNVDITACDEYGIKLFNTPMAPVDSVAELTVTAILNLLKNITPMHNSLVEKKWNKMTGYMLKGKKIGIIGFGRIGQKVAELLAPFQTEVAFNDLENKNSKFPFMEKDKLLLWADIITIHTSTCKENSFVIGEEEFKKMKKGSYLVNTSRGKFIDETALYSFLKDKHLNGAALDVFAEEPYTGKLRELDNIILTPHISSSAKESRVVMEIEAAKNLIEGLGIC